MLPLQRVPSLCAHVIDGATTGVLVAAITIAVLAPCAEAWGAGILGHQLRLVLVGSCHQAPARCWWLWGHPCALCARCLGLYGGALLGRGMYAAGDWQMPRLRVSALRSPVIWLALIAALLADWWLTGHGILPRALARASLSGLLGGAGWMLGPHRLLLQGFQRALSRLLCAQATP